MEHLKNNWGKYALAAGVIRYTPSGDLNKENHTEHLAERLKLAASHAIEKVQGKDTNENLERGILNIKHGLENVPVGLKHDFDRALTGVSNIIN